MKKLFLLVLLCVSSSGWAVCPDDNDEMDLTKLLTAPLGHKQAQPESNKTLIAVVKGRFDPVDTEQDKPQAYYFQVTQAYGLAIPLGQYQVLEGRYWGADCQFYEENRAVLNRVNRHGDVYLALQRVHGHSLVVPQGTAEGLFLNNKKQVVFVDSERPSLVKTVNQQRFESHLIHGIPLAFWHTRNK